jgi:hypothetical protein
VCLPLDVAPDSSLVPQNEASGQTRWCPWNAKWTCLALRACLHGNLSCVSICSKHHCALWRSVWKRHLADKLVSEFQIPSGVSGAPERPAIQILLYQATSPGATSIARYMKHALPIFLPMPPHIPYGLRGLPSRLWLKCNRLLRLGRPWGTVTLSRWGG